MPLENVGHEPLSQRSPAAFIADGVSQGRHGVSYAVAIVESAIGPCAKDAGYAPRTSEKGAGCAEQIGTDTDVADAREDCREQMLHPGALARTTPSSIETDGNWLKLAQMRKQFAAQYGIDILISKGYGVDALCGERGTYDTVDNECPICLSTARISYQSYLLHVDEYGFAAAKLDNSHERLLGG